MPCMRPTYPAGLASPLRRLLAMPGPPTPGSLGLSPFRRSERPMRAGEHSIVVGANRLPVGSTVDPDGSVEWTRSAGGLVTALAPIRRPGEGDWSRWAG